MATFLNNDSLPKGYLDNYLVDSQVITGLAPTIARSGTLLVQGILPTYAPTPTATTATYFWS